MQVKSMYWWRQAKKYDEDEAFDAYVSTHLRTFMTDYERRACDLAVLRQKAEYSEHDRLKNRFSDQLSKEPYEVIELSMTGYTALIERIRRRLLDSISTGELTVNRCPSCKRILRTPFAKQCLWCGHDWHNDKLRN
jgi:hypothetical protein